MSEYNNSITREDTEKENNKKTIMYVVIAAVIAFGAAWILFGGDHNEDKTSESTPHHDSGNVSGIVTFDGLAPEPNDNGEIVIAVREHAVGGVFTLVDLSAQPELRDGAQWAWDGATDDRAYDVKATLMIDDVEVTSSPIVTVTAPSSSVELVLTVNWTNLPDASISSSGNKTIAGTTAVSGYIPTGATISVFTAPARDESQISSEEVVDPKFTPVVTGIIAKANTSWEWDRALSQVEYLVQAELYDASGNYISSSHNVKASVPQGNVALAITSSASSTPEEPEAVGVSGTVELNGSYKSDSEVVVEARENGAGGFFKVDSFPAESKRNWEYKGAKNGVPYDFRATLKRDNNDIATSKQHSTAAPATGITLKINTDMDLDAPSQAPVIASCSKRDDKGYDVKLTFPGVTGAKSYWLQVGKSSSSADRLNESEQPDSTGESVHVKVKIDKDRYYYTRYAQSICSDCTTQDSYSDFSKKLKFYCGEEPDDD